MSCLDGLREFPDMRRSALTETRNNATIKHLRSGTSLMPKKPRSAASAGSHGTIGVRIEAGLARKLRVIAANEQTTIKDLVGEAVMPLIEDWEAKNDMQIRFDRKG